MQNKPLSFHEMDFVKTLVSNGYSLDTALSLLDRSEKVSTKVENTSKDVSKETKNDLPKGKSEAPKGDKKDSKSKNKSKSKGKVEDKKSSKLAFGKDLVKGSYFAWYNTKAKEPTLKGVGVVNFVDMTDKIVHSEQGDKALECCVKITAKEYKKLAKKLGKKGATKPTVKSEGLKRMPIQQLAVCYASLGVKANLLDKTDLEAAIASKSDDESDRLYQSFKKSVAVKDLNKSFFPHLVDLWNEFNLLNKEVKLSA